MKTFKFTLYFLLFAILFGCQKSEPHPYGFYYWKSKLKLTNTEQQALQQSDLPHLYTRFFDVDKEGNTFKPLGIVTKDASFQTDKIIVPTVFIINRTFLNIQQEDISKLAHDVFNLIQKKQQELGLKVSDEIQIDCDWTQGTRDDYFKFLKELKSVSQKNITSTLRLHQVKNKRNMGIPPVSKVYLMCYSTSSPLENSDKNSILDVGILKSYLSDLEEYPIKNMAVALPIYSWGIITNHLGKHRLINGLSQKDLNNPQFKRVSDHEVIVLKDDFYFGNFLNKGFHIKIEEIEDQQLKEVVDFINPKLKSFDIIYYQLDENFIQKRNLKL